MEQSTVAHSEDAPTVLSDSHAVEAIGYLSSILADRSGAWEGNAPAWFPEPPEWLELWQRSLAATAGDRRG